MYSIFPQSRRGRDRRRQRGLHGAAPGQSLTRDDNDRTQADYSTYDAAPGWSTPLPLDSTETTGDFNPVVAQVSDNTLSAAWINLIPGDNVTDTTSPQQMMDSTQIKVGNYGA